MGHGVAKLGAESIIVSARLYVLDAAEAKRGPILVDGDDAHRIESSGLESVPAGVAIKVALELLRRGFGIGEPDGRIARGARGELAGERVHLAFARDKGKEEGDLRNRFNVVVDGEHRKARKLRRKAVGRAQNDDLLLRPEVEFFENSGHGF